MEVLCPRTGVLQPKKIKTSFCQFAHSFCAFVRQQVDVALFGKSRDCWRWTKYAYSKSLRFALLVLNSRIRLLWTTRTGYRRLLTTRAVGPFRNVWAGSYPTVPPDTAIFILLLRCMSSCHNYFSFWVHRLAFVPVTYNIVWCRLPVVAPDMHLILSIATRVQNTTIKFVREIFEKLNWSKHCKASIHCCLENSQNPVLQLLTKMGKKEFFGLLSGRLSSYRIDKLS